MKISYLNLYRSNEVMKIFSVQALTGHKPFYLVSLSCWCQGLDVVSASFVPHSYVHVPSEICVASYRYSAP